MTYRRRSHFLRVLNLLSRLLVQCARVHLESVGGDSVAMSSVTVSRPGSAGIQISVIKRNFLMTALLEVFARAIQRFRERRLLDNPIISRLHDVLVYRYRV